jgi:hypothetical protein
LTENKLTETSFFGKKKSFGRFWYILPTNCFIEKFWPNAIWLKNELAKRHLFEKSFGLVFVQPNAVWSKVHFIFDLWPLIFDLWNRGSFIDVFWKKFKTEPWVKNLQNKYFFVILDTIFRKKSLLGQTCKMQALIF